MKKIIQEDQTELIFLKVKLLYNIIVILLILKLIQYHIQFHILIFLLEIQNYQNNLLSVVILGEVNVGKSNIIRRILNKDFQSQEATIGVEFGDLEVGDVDKDNPDVHLKLQLWDTCILQY